MSDYQRPRSLFWPLLLVVVGVFLVLVNIGTIKGTTWENIVIYWPVILIIGGLDGLYQCSNWAMTIVGLGLGVILLLGNLGYLPMNAWGLLVRLWPVLLVAGGLDIAFGRRYSIWNTLLRLGLGLLLVAGIVWIVVSSPFGVGVKEVPFEQKLDGATESKVTFSAPVGDISLAGGAESGLLLSGVAGIPRNMDLKSDYFLHTSGGSSLDLAAKGSSSMVMGVTSLPWDFQLNSGIPLDLRVELGVGEIDAQLDNTMMTKVSTEMAIGKTLITLPCTRDASVNIQAAIGDVELYIPKGCNVNINLETALVSHNLPAGYLKTNNYVQNENAVSNSPTLDMKIDLAIGMVKIQEIQ